MSKGSLNPNIRFLGQKVCPVACLQRFSSRCFFGYLSEYNMCTTCIYTVIKNQLYLLETEGLYVPMHRSLTKYLQGYRGSLSVGTPSTLNTCSVTDSNGTIWPICCADTGWGFLYRCTLYKGWIHLSRYSTRTLAHTITCTRAHNHAHTHAHCHTSTQA